MKIIICLLLIMTAAVAGPKEDMQNIRNKVKLELALKRLEVIKNNGDLKILYDNILRTHGRLADILSRHPEIVKNKDLKEPELSRLKVKLLSEDEDLRDINMSLIGMHRKLEAGLMKNARIKELTERVESLNSRISKLK